MTEVKGESKWALRIVQTWKTLPPPRKRLFLGYMAIGALTYSTMQLRNGWSELQEATENGKGKERKHDWRWKAVQEGMSKNSSDNLWESLWWPYYGLSQFGGICLVAVHKARSKED